LYNHKDVYAFKNSGDIFPINSTIEFKPANNNDFSQIGNFGGSGVFESDFNSSNSLVEEIKIKICKNTTNWILIFEIDFF